VNYLKVEIEEEISSNALEVERLEKDALRELLDYLDCNFYGGCGSLDSYHMVGAYRYYDAEFWRLIAEQEEDFVYLLVVDRAWHAWKFERKEDLQVLINETTAYVFWLLDSTKRVHVYFGDSDCVHRARLE
jgi:hypothetical protein